MKIIIKNEKDYKKFIKRIIIYKSIFYKYVHFELESYIDCEYMDIIINGLNIKKRNKRIQYIYDEICKILNSKMDLNICEFKENKCIVQRENHTSNCNGCCLKCIHQKDGRCNTENLTCKLFYCPTIKKKYKITKMKDIIPFKLFSLRQRLIFKTDFFASREEHLSDLYHYSLIVAMDNIFRRN